MMLLSRFKGNLSARLRNVNINLNSFYGHVPIPASGVCTIRTLYTSSNQQADPKFPSTAASNTQSNVDTIDLGRIHILGVGNIGKFFGHALASSSSPPPITLLLHRPELLAAWERSEKAIEIIQDGKSFKTAAFDVELINPSASSSGSDNGKINNLIVSTKATNSVAALQPIAHRLTQDSTILFAQNGMGTADEVSQRVFCNTQTRPRYLSCITSHGLYSNGPFSSVLAGIGTVFIDVHPQLDEARSTYLSQQLLNCPLLASKEVSRETLMQLQLEKLVVNAMINPLTVIFDRRNGDLFGTIEIYQLMQSLLSEASDVIRSFPEIRHNPLMEKCFEVSRLLNIVLDIAEKTGRNTSSMLQDIQAGRPTEIDYINGYIARRGQELGIDCTYNSRLVQLVKESRIISATEIGQYFPS